MTNQYFEFDGFRAFPDRNILERIDDSEQQILEPKTMDVLVELALHQGEAVSRQQFQDKVWEGRLISDESLSRCISELRKALGDKFRQPNYVKTISKRGYCLLTPVIWLDAPNKHSEEYDAEVKSSVTSFKNRPMALGVGLLLMLTMLALIAKATIDLIDNKDKSESPLRFTLDSPTQLYDILNNDTSDRIHAIWQHENIPSKRVELSALRYLQDNKSTLSVKIQDGNALRLLNTNLAFESPQEQDTAITSIVSALQLLTNKTIDPEIITLPKPLQLVFKQASQAATEGNATELQKAVLQFDEILAKQPDFIPAIVGKSRAYKNLSFYAEVNKKRNFQNLNFLLMQKLALADKSNPYLIATTYQFPAGKIDWESHKGILSELVDKSPNCFECVKRLADFYQILGWRNKAIDLHLKHLAYYPMSSRANAEIADIFSRAGKQEGTQKHTEIVKLMGNPRYVAAAETNNFYLQGDSEKWIKFFINAYSARGMKGPRLEIPTAIAQGDENKLRTIYQQLDFSFNLALNVKDIDAVVEHIMEQLEKGNFDILLMLHGWRHQDVPLTRLYREGLQLLKNRDEITDLFAEYGLLEYWENTNEWPDDCYLDNGLPYCDI